MDQFREILRQKIKEVAESPRKMPPVMGEGAGLPARLLAELFRLNPYPAQRENSGFIPATAKIYKERQADARRTQARLKAEKEKSLRQMRRDHWTALGAESLKCYQVFLELGEWNFSPLQYREIKKAYRRLLLKYHPDVHSHPEAHALTQRIIDAYDRLLDGGRSL